MSAREIYRTSERRRHAQLTQGRRQRSKSSSYGLCALIPIKERVHCKTRLAGALEPTARLALVRSMLMQVVQAAVAATAVRRVLVISPCRDTVPTQIPVLHDTGRSLNAALSQALRQLRSQRCTEAVILAADLPEVTAADIDALVEAGRERVLALAPDATETGTNALYLPTSLPFRFRFGSDSHHLHRWEARQLGLDPAIVRRPGLAFDVDLPADLCRLDRTTLGAQLAAVQRQDSQTAGGCRHEKRPDGSTRRR